MLLERLQARLGSPRTAPPPPHEVTAGTEESCVKQQRPPPPLYQPSHVISEGKVHAGNFTVQCWYPFTVRFTLFLFSKNNKATTSSLPSFHALLYTLVFFFCVVVFSKRCVTGLRFFSPVTEHRKCVVSKQVPVTVSTPCRGPQS